MKIKKEISNKASISYSNKNLSNLSSIPNNVPVEKIDLSGNPIFDFTGLKPFPELHILDCSNTNLISFGNFPNQEGIKAFICKKTPLSSYQFIYLMCAVVFGPSLESVNGINITQATKSNALTISTKIRPFLTKGWIIQNLDPIKIMHIQTRQRKTFYIKFEQNDNLALESPRTNFNHDSSNFDDESDQDVYLEEDSEYDIELSTNKSLNGNGSLENNENLDEGTTQIKVRDEIAAENEVKPEDEEDERLRERFIQLQESILLEIKRPDVIPTVIKSGRVTALSNHSSRPSTSLSSRQLLSLHPRTQTSLKNYSIKKESPKND